MEPLASHTPCLGCSGVRGPRAHHRHQAAAPAAWAPGTAPSLVLPQPCHARRGVELVSTDATLPSSPGVASGLEKSPGYGQSQCPLGSHSHPAALEGSFGTTEPGTSAERFPIKVYFFHSQVLSLCAPTALRAGTCWPAPGLTGMLSLVLSRMQWDMDGLTAGTGRKAGPCWDCKDQPWGRMRSPSSRISSILRVCQLHVHAGCSPSASLVSSYPS